MNILGSTRGGKMLIEANLCVIATLKSLSVTGFTTAKSN